MAETTSSRRREEVRVLVADDHEAVRTLYAVLLGALDGVDRVVHAADGAEAVAVATAMALDVAVLDFDMPRLNGVAAAAELASLQPGLAIALQSSDYPALRQRARGLGWPLFDKGDFDGVVGWVEGEVAKARAPRLADVVCVRCGYGIARTPPRRCPMCSAGGEWVAPAAVRTGS